VLALFARSRVAFWIVQHHRRPESRISKLNTQPADTPIQRFKCSIAAALACLGARWIATPFLYDSFIRYFMPVYPGAIWTFPSQARFWRVGGIVRPQRTSRRFPRDAH